MTTSLAASATMKYERAMFRFFFFLLLAASSFAFASAQNESWLPTNLEVITPENVDQLTQVASLGRGKVTAHSWAPDSDHFAVATLQGMWIYSTDDWFAQHLELPNPFGEIKSIWWLRDGNRIITDHLDRNYYEEYSQEAIYIWDLSDTIPSPRLLREFDVMTEIGVDLGQPIYHQGSVLNFNADQTLLLVNVPQSAYRTYTAYLIDIASSDVLAKINLGLLFARFTPDGAYVEVENQVWNVEELIRRREINAGRDEPEISDIYVPTRSAPTYVSSLEIRCTDDRIDFDSKESAELCPETEITFHDSGIIRLPYHVESVSRIHDGSVWIVYECLQKQQPEYYQIGMYSFRCVQTNIRFLDAATGEQVASLPPELTSIHYRDLDISPDQRWAVTLSDIMRVWDLTTYEQHTWFSDYSDLVRNSQPAFSASSNRLAVATNETVQLWDVVDRRLLALMPFGSKVSHVEISADGNRVAAAGEGEQVLVWDVPLQVTTSTEPLVLANSLIIQQNLESSDSSSVFMNSDGTLLTSYETMAGKQLWSISGDTPVEIPLPDVGQYGVNFDGDQIVLSRDEERTHWDTNIVRENGAFTPEALLSEEHVENYTGYSIIGTHSLPTMNGDTIEINFPAETYLGWPRLISPNRRLLISGSVIQTDFGTVFYGVDTGLQLHGVEDQTAIALTQDGKLILMTNDDVVSLWGIPAE